MEEDIDVAGRGFSREPVETGQFPGVKHNADAENFSDTLKKLMNKYKVQNNRFKSPFSTFELCAVSGP